jgi:hypothetical protein
MGVYSNSWRKVQAAHSQGSHLTRNESGQLRDAHAGDIAAGKATSARGGLPMKDGFARQSLGSRQDQRQYYVYALAVKTRDIGAGVRREENTRLEEADTTIKNDKLNLRQPVETRRRG